MESTTEILQQPDLPWRVAISMSWVNIRHRKGRFALIFMAIAVVVAFLMSSFTYSKVVAGLAASTDVHIRAALERAALFSDDAMVRSQQHDREIWLLSLSCVLCVVVITNTMLMSVMERTSEIGTLKCLGALDRFIVRTFLIESVFIGVISSFAGALAGYALTVLQLGALLGFRTIMSAETALPLVTGIPLALGIGTLITVAAAAYPAFVAAKMRPIDAMRSQV